MIGEALEHHAKQFGVANIEEYGSCFVSLGCVKFHKSAPEACCNGSEQWMVDTVAATMHQWLPHTHHPCPF